MTGTPPRAPASATPFQREFLNILADGDPRAAARLANRLVNAGVPLSSVVLDLLAPAQVEVGRRWQVADWTVAHEHAATAATDAALAAAVLYGGSRHEFAPHGPTLVVACAEGEWHTMPSRMAAEVLTAAGLRVTLLGPSLPAAHLQTYLTMVQPTALGLSCTLPLNLPGARRCVLAAHEVGVPVIAAGRAFGVDGRRARAVGADCWEPPLTAIPHLLAGWQQEPPVLRTPVPEPVETSRLDTLGPGFVHAVVDELIRARPEVAGYDKRQLERTREDVDYIRRFLSCALLIDDSTLFTDFVSWLRDLLAARGVARDVLVDSLRAIYRELGDGLPATRALLDRSLDVLKDQP